MNSFRRAIALPVRWLSARIAVFMWGVGASGGGINLIRDGIRQLRDPDVRRQIAKDRSVDRQEKALAKRLCALTEPDARAMLVKILIAISEHKLPVPSSHALRSAAGHAREQVNDTHNDSLTLRQERNVFERTSRRMSFMKMCIGTGAAFTAYIDEHHHGFEEFLRHTDVTTEELLETLLIIGNGVKATRKN